MNELERYLSEPNIFDSKFQILVWWKQNAARYPILSTLVKDLMATPVSTIASKSAFSTGGRVVDNYRSFLKPEMAEALICTQNWLRLSLCHFKDLQLDEKYEISESTITDLHMILFGGGERASHIHCLLKLLLENESETYERVT